MGCASSTEKPVEVEAPADKTATPADPANVQVDLSKMGDGCSTIELFDGIFKVAEPLIRQAVCKALIYRLWNESLGLRLDEKTMDTYDSRELPLEPFEVAPRAIHLLTFEELKASKGEWKNFSWPEDLEELYNSEGFIAADLLDVTVRRALAPRPPSSRSPHCTSAHRRSRRCCRRC